VLCSADAIIFWKFGATSCLKNSKNITVNSISPLKWVGTAYPLMRAHFRAIEDPDDFNAFSTALTYLWYKTMCLSAVKNIKRTCINHKLQFLSITFVQIKRWYVYWLQSVIIQLGGNYPKLLFWLLWNCILAFITKLQAF
jgi:hypothetical protein